MENQQKPSSKDIQISLNEENIKSLTIDAGLHGIESLFPEDQALLKAHIISKLTMAIINQEPDLDVSAMREIVDKDKQSYCFLMDATDGYAGA
ncbi:hypothetical protein KAI58_05125 [Candidatus Gracilibacteria bacterium]|nr:hypothetical protein [Candidatus Gracilibacteria bacterium]